VGLHAEVEKRLVAVDNLMLTFGFDGMTFSFQQSLLPGHAAGIFFVQDSAGLQCAPVGIGRILIAR
jgi:hypothetical protein